MISLPAGMTNSGMLLNIIRNIQRERYNILCRYLFYHFQVNKETRILYLLYNKKGQ